MALLSSLLMALLVLNCSSLCSMGCGLSEHHLSARRKTLPLLEEMRRLSPVSCLKDRYDFEFPQEVFNSSQFQEAQDIFVLQKMLEQILHLFSRENSSTVWDETLLKQFCSVLEEQLTDLDTCKTQEMLEEDSPLVETDSQLAMRKYFQRITLYLQEKKHSPCAWEIVRVEIIKSFFSSAKLLKRLMRKD